MPERALRDRLRDGIPAAMKRRDRPTLDALRHALAAVDNAEAVVGASPVPPLPEPSDAPIASSTAGLGSTEHVRRALTDDDVHLIVTRHVEGLEASARELDRLGRQPDAERLRAEARALRAHLAS